MTFDDVRYNFWFGAFITLPYGHTPVTAYIYDPDDNNKLVKAKLLVNDTPHSVTDFYASPHYFKNWKIVIESNGNVLEEVFDPTGENIYIEMDSAALGDSFAWMPSVEAFQKKWNCTCYVSLKEPYQAPFKDVNKNIHFISKEDALKHRWDFYASYAVFFTCDTNHMDWTVTDQRKLNIQSVSDKILGVETKGIRPTLVDIPEYHEDKPYICIATTASRPCKEWQNKGGWEAVVKELNNMGYNVYCIDSTDRNKPVNAIDDTGFKPLTERLKRVKGADLFIGLPSGLSWLAWAVNTPVVLISGFSDAYVEMEDAYRVSPPEGVCHGCWGYADAQSRKHWKECWLDKDCECTKMITPEMVMEQVRHALKC